MNLTQKEHIFQQGQTLATATPATETLITEVYVRHAGKNGRRVLPKYPHTSRGYSTISRLNIPPDVCDKAVQLIAQYSDNRCYTTGSENSCLSLIHFFLKGNTILMVMFLNLKCGEKGYFGIFHNLYKKNR